MVSRRAKEGEVSLTSEGSPRGGAERRRRRGASTVGGGSGRRRKKGRLRAAEGGVAKQRHKRAAKNRPARKPGAFKKQARLIATATAICAAAALIFSILMGTDLVTVASLLLFRSSSPYMDPKKEKRLEADFKRMIQEEFSGGGKKAKVRLP